MLEILKQKILSWDPETANQFHGNISRHQYNRGQMWELTSTGYFLYAPNKAENRDYNGTRFELAQGDFVTQLNFKKELAELLETKTGVLLEKPSLILLTDIYGITYTYSRQVNPTQTRGIPVANLKDVKTNIVETYLALTEAVFKSYEELILAIDELTGSTTEMRYPETLRFDAVALDASTNKFFLTGDFDFIGSREDFISYARGWIEKSDEVLSKLAGQPLSISSQITNFANTQCTIFQPQ